MHLHSCILAHVVHVCMVSLKPRELKQCICGTVVMNMFIVNLNESVHGAYAVV